MNTNYASRIAINSALVVSSFLWSCQGSETGPEVNQEKSTAIKPPFPHIKLAAEEFNVNPKKDTVLALGDGSELIIKANSFVNQKGNTVDKPVKVSYTPMRDAASIMASGVPMQFNDPKTGKNGSFESAGMFKIEASAEGIEVEINKNKPIIAELASNEAAGGYANYFFNETTANWEEIADETIRANEDKAQAKKELDDLMNRKPFSGKNYFALNSFVLLDFELKNNDKKLRENLENTSYKKICDKFSAYGANIYRSYAYGGIEYLGGYVNAEDYIWQKLSSEKVPQWVYERSYFKAKKTKEKDIYSVTIIDDLMKDSVNFRAKIIMSCEQLLGKTPKNWLKNSKEFLAQIENSKKRYEAFADYKRTLSIDQKGIYNCDRLYNNPAARHTTLDIELLGENVKAANPEKIYLISTLYNNALELNFSNPFVLPIEEDKTARLVTVYSDLSIAEVDNQQLLSAYHHAANSKEPFKISFKRLVKPRTLEDLHAALAQK